MKIEYVNGFKEGWFYLLNFIIRDEVTEKETKTLIETLDKNLVSFLKGKIHYLGKLNKDEEDELEKLRIITIDLPCNIRMYLDINRCFGLKIPTHKNIFKIVHEKTIEEGLKEVAENILEGLT